MLEYRDRDWWNSNKLIPNYIRQKLPDHPTQRDTSNHHTFEDSLYLLLGEDWPLNLAASDAKTWLNYCRTKSSDYLLRHSFPPDPRIKAPTTDNDTTPQPPLKKPRTNKPTLRPTPITTPAPTAATSPKPTPTSSTHDPASSSSSSSATSKHVEGSDEHWQSNHHCVRIVVDNQTLSEAINGHSVLKDVEMRPIFCRITRHVEQLYERGQLSPTKCIAMLDWRPRELNTEADSACNLVLDRKASFKWFSQNFAKHVRCNLNIYMHSDGGCRKTGVSATGWRIAAVHLHVFTRAVTIVKGGSLIEGNLKLPSD